MDGTAALAALGLMPGASPAQIKAAYRRAVKHVHPDRAGSTDAFLALQEAYQQAEFLADQPPVAPPPVAPLPVAPTPIGLTVRRRAPRSTNRWFRGQCDPVSAVDLVDVRRPPRPVRRPDRDSFEAHLALALAS